VNCCTSHILSESSHGPSNLKFASIPGCSRNYHGSSMRSASIWISAESSTGTQLKGVCQEASDSVEDEDVDIHQDSGESDADESKSVESFAMKRRRSQQLQYR